MVTERAPAPLRFAPPRRPDRKIRRWLRAARMAALNARIRTASPTGMPRAPRRNKRSRRTLGTCRRTKATATFCGRRKVLVGPYDHRWTSFYCTIIRGPMGTSDLHAPLTALGLGRARLNLEIGVKVMSFLRCLPDVADVPEGTAEQQTSIHRICICGIKAYFRMARNPELLLDEPAKLAPSVMLAKAVRYKKIRQRAHAASPQRCKEAPRTISLPAPRAPEMTAAFLYAVPRRPHKGRLQPEQDRPYGQQLPGRR